MRIAGLPTQKSSGSTVPGELAFKRENATINENLGLKGMIMFKKAGESDNSEATTNSHNSATSNIRTSKSIRLYNTSSEESSEESEKEIQKPKLNLLINTTLGLLLFIKCLFQ